MMSVNPYCYFDNPTVENLESLMNQQLEEITGQFENKIADLEEQLAEKEPQAKQQKSFNSLASFVTSYNLPQVAALILGISFEYIHITRQTAQIDENEFSYDIVIKFDKLLQSLIAMAESGNLQGFNIAYFEQNNPVYAYNSYGDNPQYPTVRKFDYLNSVIDKASLETYLKSIGRDLCQLLELQEPLTQTPPPNSSELAQHVEAQQATIDHQAQEIAELKAKLERTNTTAKGIIPVDFASDEMAEVKQVADSKGITPTELVETSIRQQLAEIRPFARMTTTATDDQTATYRQELTDFVKVNIADPIEFYRLLAKAKVLPIEQAGTDTATDEKPSYTTKAITALNHVIAEFWQNWEVGTKPPKQEYIEAWIIENYPTINKTTAKTIDRLARHESVK